MKQQAQSASHPMTAKALHPAGEKLEACPECRGAGAQAGKKWCDACGGTGYVLPLEANVSNH